MAEGTSELTAAELAELIGRTKRRVLQWAGEGCPCTMGKRGGRECQLFDTTQVREWLASKGRAIPEAIAEQDEPVEPGPVSTEAGEGPPDWDKISTQLESSLKKMLDKVEKSSGADPAGTQKLMQAIKQTAGELRGVEEMRYKQSERERRHIDRTVAAEILESQAAMFVADLGSLESDMPRAIVEAIGQNPEGFADETAMLRTLGQVTRKQIDKLRDRRASMIERGLSEIGKGAAA